MLLGTLGTTLLWNKLTGKGTIRTGLVLKIFNLKKEKK